ncbi:hypothetical protein FB451DRAFT_1165978 [Mycena latifolia]|nr:hypothetical protein FB451DRAFT_1165978 [Mycena latifolia]
MENPTIQLAATVLLSSLSLIPNNPVPYTALGITTCLGAIYVIYLKHPSTQLRQLEEMIEGTDALSRRAKSQCPRDHISLAEQALRLLQVTQATSSIKSRLLDTQRLTWKTYRRFSKDITELTTCVKNIHNALTVEAERQRKLAMEINEAQFILCTVTGCHRAGGTANGYPPCDV